MSIAVRLLVHFRADFKQKRELLTQYYPSFGVPATIFITILHLSISFPFFPENLSPRRFHNWTRAPTGWPMRRSKGKCSICFRSQPIFSSFLPVRTCIFFRGHAKPIAIRPFISDFTSVSLFFVLSELRENIQSS